MNKPANHTPETAGGKLIVTGALLLVLLPVTFYGCRGELDRWRAAVVIENYLDGDREVSIEELQAISRRLPLDYRLKMRLAGWLLEDRQADQALTLLDEIPEPYRDGRTSELRQRGLLATGKPAEALRVYREANPANVTRSPEETVFHKNSLAYYQALASTELELALQNSNDVVHEVASVWNYRQQFRMSSRLQTLFCASVVYLHEMRQHPHDQTRQRECARNAAQILAAGIGQLEHEYEVTCRMDPALVRQVFDQIFDGGSGGEPPRLPTKVEKKEETAQNLVAFRVVRALIYQELGMDQASFRDRRGVLKLGFDPERVADMLPSFDDCTNQLGFMAMFLDTRGCVYYELRDHATALADLNSAVIAQRALVEVADIMPRTRFEMSLDPRQQHEVFVRGPRKTLAALLYHRSWARRAAGNEKLAGRDEAEIRELGFEPDDYLF